MGNLGKQPLRNRLKTFFEKNKSTIYIFSFLFALGSAIFCLAFDLVNDINNAEKAFLMERKAARLAAQQKLEALDKSTWTVIYRDYLAGSESWDGSRSAISFVLKRTDGVRLSFTVKESQSRAFDEWAKTLENDTITLITLPIDKEYPRFEDFLKPIRP